MSHKTADNIWQPSDWWADTTVDDKASREDLRALLKDFKKLFSLLPFAGTRQVYAKKKVRTAGFKIVCFA